MPQAAAFARQYQFVIVMMQLMKPLLQLICAIVAAVACQVAKAFQEETCQAEVGSPVAFHTLVGEACQGVGAWVAHSQEGALACLVGTHTLAGDTGHLKGTKLCRVST